MAFGKPLARETKVLSPSRGTSFKNKRFVSAEKRRQKTGWIKSDFQTRKQKRMEVRGAWRRRGAGAGMMQEPQISQLSSV